MNFMRSGLYEIHPEIETRSISPENLTGARGAGGMCELENGSARNAARDLGKGWKVNPYLVLQPGETDGAQWATFAQVHEMIRTKQICKVIGKQFLRHAPMLMERQQTQK